MGSTGSFLGKYILEGRDFYLSLFKIALPIIIQNFITSSLNMMDTVMIGKVGEVEIAAVGIANQYFFFFTLIFFGIYSGCGIFISQFWGKKDWTNIRRMLGAGLIAGTIVSVIPTLAAFVWPEKIIGMFNQDPAVIESGVKYLRIVGISYIFTSISFGYGSAARSVENTVMPMIVSGIALLCNTVLNYVFIFGHFGVPKMGVEGAALATVIARVLELAIIMLYIYKSGGVLAASMKEMLDISQEFVGRVVKTVTPVVLNEGCWGLGFVVYSVAYGRIGTQAIASVQICNTIINLFLVVIFGMANASTVMIGNKIGAGEEEQGKVYARRFSILACIIGLVLGAVLALSAPMLLTLFNVSGEVLKSSLDILYITSFIMILRVFNIMAIVGILRGGGDARFSLITEAITMWGIGVPLAFFGAFFLKLPVQWVAALVTFEELVKFIVSFMRLASNKWIKNVIHGM